MKLTSLNFSGDIVMEDFMHTSGQSIVKCASIFVPKISGSNDVPNVSKIVCIAGLVFLCLVRKTLEYLIASFFN